jgi:hypothetical protein
MKKVVLLDACTLGMVSNPNDSADNLRCQGWAMDLHRKGTVVCIPEIADYETRRELIRSNKSVGLAELDRVIAIYRYIPLCTKAMRLAAQFWSDARMIFRAAATNDQRLDADMIVCAQAKVIEMDEGGEVIVATSNVRHLVTFVSAREWYEIDP